MQTFSKDVFEFREARILGGDEGVDLRSEERMCKPSLRMCLSLGMPGYLVVMRGWSWGLRRGCGNLL